MVGDRRAQSAGLHQAGVAAAHAEQFESARQLLQQALETAGGLHAPPERGLIQRNLAEVNRRLGRTSEAIEAGAAAVRLLGPDAPALLNLGVALSDAGLDEAAMRCFDQALAIDAGLAPAHFARAEILLRRGEFAQGWLEYAWRARLDGVRPLVPADILSRADAWDGAAGAATLLIVADQGFGDMIFFARFLAWAEARCWRLVVHAPPALFALLRGIARTARLIDDWNDLADCSAWCALSDLPRLARGADAEAPVPYMAVPPSTRERWAYILNDAVPPRAGARRIGLVWAGQAAQAHDLARSLPLQRLAPLTRIDGVDWVSLQKGEPAAQLAAMPASMADIGAMLRDFADTAAVLSLLDLVVTVDTSVAHLAGALGRPVWVLLRHRPDWRWEGNMPSRWYPTARLFRQARAGDWDGVVQAVRQSLAVCA